MKIIVTDLAVVAPLSAKERAIVETLQKEKYHISFKKSARETLSSDKLKRTVVDMVSSFKKDELEKACELLNKVVFTCLDDFTSADWNSCEKTFIKICNYDDWERVVFETSVVIVTDVLREITNYEFSGFEIG